MDWSVLVALRSLVQYVARRNSFLYSKLKRQMCQKKYLQNCWLFVCFSMQNPTTMLKKYLKISNSNSHPRPCNPLLPPYLYSCKPTGSQYWFLFFTSATTVRRLLVNYIHKIISQRLPSERELDIVQGRQHPLHDSEASRTWQKPLKINWNVNLLTFHLSER